MSTLKVGAIRGVSASSDAITVANDGTCTAKITNNLSNKNLIINGACLIAQRGVSSTSTGYQTVDRFQTSISGTDETPAQTQADVASGTTPYTEGFRKSYKIQNGNQTSGAGTSDRVGIEYRIESQDIANSGWNYNSASSFITLSYWVKSSVAQNFYVRFKSADSPQQAYVIETGSLSADTWTKITKTIPGNSNIVFNNDTDEGLSIVWEIFRGTSQTGTRPLNAWAAADNNTRTPDQTSTWYTTNNATFEITGVQLEVGSVATDFEHRSFGKELQLCKRYFNNFGATTATGTSATYMLIQGGYARFGSANSIALQRIFYDVEMRATPTIKYGRNTDNDDFSVMRWSSDGSNPVVFLGSTEGSNQCGFQITRYNAGSGSNPVTETYNDGDSFTHQISKFRADAEL